MNGTSNTNGTPSLALGAKGLAVQEVQLRLQQLRYDVDPDGVYGEKTFAAVKLFQRDSNISVDGVVGVTTWRALESQTVDPLPSRGVTSEPVTVEGEVSRPDVEQGGAAARVLDLGKPGSLFSSPLVKWGLIAAGVLGVFYLLQKDRGGLSGYRRLLDDDEPEPKSEPKVVGHGSTKSAARSVVGEKRCPRVPSEDKLKEAEELEVAA